MKKLLKLSGEPENFPNKGKLTPQSSKNFILSHKGLLSALIGYVIRDSACPDLLKDPKTMFSRFFTLYEDRGTYDINEAASDAALKNLYDNFDPTKVVCNQLSSHSAQFARLVSHFRFFLKVFNLPDSRFSMDLILPNPVFQDDYEFLSNGCFKTGFSQTGCTTDQVRPKIYISADPNAKEHVCFHTFIDPEFLERYTILYDRFSKFLSDCKKRAVSSSSWFLPSGFSIFDNLFQEAFISPTSPTFKNLSEYENCSCVNLIHIMIDSHSFNFTENVFTDGLMVVSRLNMNVFHVKPKFENVGIGEVSKIQRMPDGRVRQDRDFFGISKQAGGPKDDDTNKIDPDRALINEMERLGYMAEDFMTGGVCLDAPYDYTKPIAQAFSDSSDSETDESAENSNARRRVELTEDFAGVMCRQVLGRFSLRSFRSSSRLIHHPGGVFGSLKEIREKFNDAVFKWIRSESPENGLMVCPVFREVHVIFEMEYYKFPFNALRYFQDDGVLRLPQVSAGLSREFCTVINVEENVFCLDQMRKMSDF